MNGATNSSEAGNKTGSSVPSISPAAPAKMHDDLGTSPAAEPELPHLHLHHSDHHQDLAQQEYYLRSSYEQQYPGYAFYSHPESSYYSSRDAALMHPPLMHAPYDDGDDEEEEEEDEHGSKRRAHSPGSVGSGSSGQGAIGVMGDCCSSLSMHHHHLHAQDHAPYVHHDFSGMLPLIRPDLAHHHHSSPHQHTGVYAQAAAAHAAAAASLSSAYSARVPDSRSARIRMMRAAAASINERSNAYKSGGNNARDSANGSDDDMDEFPIAKLAIAKLAHRQPQPSSLQLPLQHQQQQQLQHHQSTPRTTQQYKAPPRRASVSSSTHECDSTAAAAEPGSISGGNVGSGDRKTSARRAEQNRTAQRAFRERRQHYVKDLEEKAAQADTLDSRILQADGCLADIQSIAERLAADREAWMREREMWWRERDEAVTLANSLVTELDALNKENCRFREVLDGLSSAAAAGKGELPASLLPMAQLALQLQTSIGPPPGSRKRTVTELEFEDMIMAAPLENSHVSSGGADSLQKRARTSSSSSTCGSASDGDESANVAALRDLLRTAHAKHANQPMTTVESPPLAESSRESNQSKDSQTP
ncbi:hypothetical protein HDU86_007001 [Geranomyces michiganensis]|nr:hypothetical protein HDU86_007001 [Geranomyces michiganensis]